jgi:hypothetical protein
MVHPELSGTSECQGADEWRFYGELVWKKQGCQRSVASPASYDLAGAGRREQAQPADRRMLTHLVGVPPTACERPGTYVDCGAVAWTV